MRLWEEAHGESPEGQAYLTLATLRDQDPEAFAQGVCAGLARGSAAAICHYGMTRCSSPAAMTPGVRAMDEAFQKSPAFAEHGCGTEVETCSFLLSRDEMRLQSLSGASMPDSDRRITARSLGLTALKLACQLDFPAAFAAFAWNWTTFQSVMKLRETKRPSQANSSSGCSGDQTWTSRPARCCSAWSCANSASFPSLPKRKRLS